MTHVLDTSAALAGALGERGGDRVGALIADPQATVGVSVLTLYEVYTVLLHRTGSDEIATEGIASLRRSVAEVLPVTDAVLDLHRASAARIALADLLIAATAARAGATLVHRDPHFAALPAERPAQETLPDKARAHAPRRRDADRTETVLRA